MCIRDRHIRKAHSAWDRARGDFAGAIMQSKTNENTKGCKFEKDLEVDIESGSQLDQELVHFEAKFARGERYTNEELERAATVTKNIKELIKSSTKKVQGLKLWFKM
eukprot:3605132-Alexandrium_andersonii.AAC.1